MNTTIVFVTMTGVHSSVRMIHDVTEEDVGDWIRKQIQNSKEVLEKAIVIKGDNDVVIYKGMELAAKAWTV